MSRPPIPALDPEAEDLILPEGNLTMEHVEYLFQNLLHKEIMPGSDVGRSFGEVLIINSDSLEEKIEATILGIDAVEHSEEKIDARYDRSLGNNRVFLLLDTKNQMPDNLQGDLSKSIKSSKYNHWTALNIRVGEDEDGQKEVIYRYADSLGNRDGKDVIPDIVLNALQSVVAKGNIIKGDGGEIIKLISKEFPSIQQSDANCGYNAVYHALQMLDKEVKDESIDEFICRVKPTLVMRYGEHVIEEVDAVTKGIEFLGLEEQKEKGDKSEEENLEDEFPKLRGAPEDSSSDEEKQDPVQNLPKELKPDPKAFIDDNYSRIKAIVATTKQRSGNTPPQKKYLEFGDVSGDLRDPQDYFLIITIDNKGNVQKEENYSFGQRKGFDENFRTSEAKYFFDQDETLGIKAEKVNFSKCFVISRLGPHEYIHALGEGKSTTGHLGALYSDFPLEGSNQRTVGSLGAGGLHSGRHSAIKAVIDDDEIKSSDKPREATVEALKFVIKTTVGYKDLQNEKIKFKGITASGLDLSKIDQREYALKTFQAVRDKYKLTVLKLRNKFADLRIDTDVSEFNEKLSEEGLTPVRCNTPYSKANFDFMVDRLKGVNSFEEVAGTTTKLTPPIMPKSVYDQAKAKHFEDRVVVENKKTPPKDIADIIDGTMLKTNGYRIGPRYLQKYRTVLEDDKSKRNLTEIDFRGCENKPQAITAIEWIIFYNKKSLTNIDLRGVVTKKNIGNVVVDIAGVDNLKDVKFDNEVWDEISIIAADRKREGFNSNKSFRKMERYKQLRDGLQADSGLLPEIPTSNDEAPEDNKSPNTSFSVESAHNVVEGLTMEQKLQDRLGGGILNIGIEGDYLLLKYPQDFIGQNKILEKISEGPEYVLENNEVGQEVIKIKKDQMTELFLHQYVNQNRTFDDLAGEDNEFIFNRIKEEISPRSQGR